MSVRASVAGTVLIGMMLFAPSRASAQVDLSGQWATHSNEDQPHRAPGPELGDYTGLPINADARQKAESWDAIALSEPERQAQPHPAQYSMRGPGPNLSITTILDPATEQLIGYRLIGFYGRADRTIWLDGRSHPSALAEHTWGGFSTGEWTGDELVVTTTHMKMAVIQRNGVPSSPYARMTEHFFRHGLYMTVISWIDDPIYLEEPIVRSMTWEWAPNQTVPQAGAFEAVEELGGAPKGYVPHYPVGTHHPEFAAATGLPFDATQGGKATIYPEYMLELQRMKAEKNGAERNSAEKNKEKEVIR